MATITHDSTSSGEQLNIQRLGRPLLFGGVIITLAYWVFMFTNPGVLSFGSYMFGFIFWVSMTLGMFGMSLLHNTVRGTWTVSIIRLLEAGGSATSLLTMAVLFLPILVKQDVLYDWADAAKRAADPVMNHRSNYLNPLLFDIRFVFYFATWAGLAYFLRKSVFRQEAGEGFKLEMGRSSWGAVGMLYFFISVTFAVTDWLMSMDNHWMSTMYGTWFIIMSCGAALAFCLMVFNANADKRPYRDVISPTLTKDLGNMQFTLTMLWGYTSLSQFLIIWNGNIPETASYYRTRSSETHPIGMESNHWGILGLALILGRFFVPFFALLSPRVKKYSENLRMVGGWIFFMHVIEIYLLVQPTIHGRAILGPFADHILYDLWAWVGLGLIWIGVFAAQTAKAPLLPTYDMRLEAMKHAH